MTKVARILSCTSFFFPQKTCISRPYCSWIWRELIKLARNWKPRYTNPRYAGTRCIFLKKPIKIKSTCRYGPQWCPICSFFVNWAVICVEMELDLVVQKPVLRGSHIYKCIFLKKPIQIETAYIFGRFPYSVTFFKWKEIHVYIV